MNRKNTILIAVMINVGLLAVLMIAALTSQEETISPSVLMGDAPSTLPKMDDNPLFGSAVDLALRQPMQTQPEAPVQIPLPEFVKPAEPLAQLPIVAPAEESLVHKLPPLVPETVAKPAIAIPAPTAMAVRKDSPFAELTVKKGDNLEKIAKAHHTSVDEIIKINQLPSSFLRIGQVLKIPAEKSLASVPKTKSVSEKKSEGGPEYYTVKVGDNPWTISMKHHMKVEELLKLNGLNEEQARKLKPGNRLRTR